MSDPLLAEPDLANHLGYIFAEEDALKNHLSGITVPERPDSAKRIPVGVWFRYPEGETQIRYPFITIDLLSAEPNYELWTSTYFEDPEKVYRPDFSPTLPTPPDGWARQAYNVPNFLSFRLVWQISHFARSALHDRYLTSIFTTDIIPPRPFFVYVAADDTMRRVEVLQRATNDSVETTESGTKRIFRKVMTVSMLAEIPQVRLASDAAVYRALRVLIPVVALEEFDSYYAAILDGHSDPLNEFSTQERADEGEFFHVWHEGHDVSAP